MNFSTLASLTFALLILLTPNNAIALDLSHAPEDAKAYIVEPTDGATVPETFTVKFGLLEWIWLLRE